MWSFICLFVTESLVGRGHARIHHLVCTISSWTLPWCVRFNRTSGFRPYAFFGLVRGFMFSKHFFYSVSVIECMAEPSRISLTSKSHLVFVDWSSSSFFWVYFNFKCRFTFVNSIDLACYSDYSGIKLH